MKTVNVLSIEQIYQNEQTRVWFEYKGETMAIALGNEGYELLDAEGYPLENTFEEEEFVRLYTRIAIHEYLGEDTQINEEYII